jgi:hypothetical protein
MRIKSNHAVQLGFAVAALLAASNPGHAADCAQGVCPTISQSGNRITLAWQSAQSYSTYHIRWSRAGRESSESATNASGTSGSWVFNNPRAGVDYTFAVQGCNGGSCTGWSELSIRAR